MPGMGKHGVFGVVAVSALCLLGPARLHQLCANTGFFSLSVRNFLLFIRMSGLERSEGMRKRFLFVSLGRCTGK